MPAMILITSRLLPRSEEHTSELQSRQYLVCRLLLEKKKTRGESAQLTHNTSDHHDTAALAAQRPVEPTRGHAPQASDRQAPRRASRMLFFFKKRGPPRSPPLSPPPPLPD